MAVELTAPVLQTVPVGENVLFPFTAIPCRKGYVVHREGSGILKLRGIVNGCQDFARYKVFFSGDLGIPAGGVAPAAVTLAISLDGEPIATMTEYPAAVERYSNVAKETYIDVPRGCCLTIAVKNTSAVPVNVQNANIIVERVA